MLTTLLEIGGPTLLGTAGILYLLWRGSVKDTTIAETRAKLNDAQTQNGALVDAVKQWSARCDQLQAEITQVEKERDNALDALEKSNSPGVFADLLRKRNKVPDAP